MPYKDQEKAKAARRKWHKENYSGDYRDRQRKSVSDRKKSLARLLREYKDQLSCEICGESSNCCLDFHHKNSKAKDITVSLSIRQGWSWERILSEIEKCRVVCKNCHAKIHDTGECSKD